MKLDVLADAIRQAILAGDYFRRPALRVAGREPLHKEWLHFCCATDSLDLLINLSVSPSGGCEVPRLVCAVRGPEWDGDVDSYAAADMRVRAGSPDISLGPSFTRFDGAHYLLDIRLKRRPISARLVLRPTTIPSQGNNIELRPGRRIHWFLVPHLLASGEVRVGDVVHELNSVPAYHDHNWGSFSWGGDCCWIWGYGHGRSGGSAWTIIFARLSNLARTVDFARGLVLWRDGRQTRVFEDEDIAVHYRGEFRPTKIFRLPKLAGLYHPELSVDVPARFELVASRGHDRLELSFDAEDLCQVVIPNEDDLRSTVINEVVGKLRVSGCVRGESFAFATRSMFEFLHG